MQEIMIHAARAIKILAIFVFGIESVFALNSPQSKMNMDTLSLKGYILYSSYYSTEEKGDGVPQEVYLIPSESFNDNLTVEENLAQRIKSGDFEVYEVIFSPLKFGIPELGQKLESISKTSLAATILNSHFDSYLLFFGLLHWNTGIEKEFGEKLKLVFNNNNDRTGHIGFILNDREQVLKFRSFNQSNYLIGVSYYKEDGETLSFFIDLDYTFKK